VTRELAQAGTRDEVVWQLMAEVARVFNASVAVAFPAGQKLAAHPDSSLTLTEKELNVAGVGVSSPAGRRPLTTICPAPRVMHLPLATERAALGVLSVRLRIGH